MKIRELEERLRLEGVPEYLYNLKENGRTDERFCLQKMDGKWNVYFSERGIKTTDEFFDSEDMACQFLLKQLLD